MLVHRNPTPQPPSRVVVLGSHGFIASRLIRTLPSKGIASRAVASAEVDLTARSAGAKLPRILMSADALVVTSALTPEHGRDRDTFLKNVAMIDTLCAALQHAPCTHVIYLSSDSVYDSRVEMVDEDTPCESNDLYALAHMAREKLLEDACRTAGVPLAIIRPCAVYGAGDTHNSYGPNRFLRTARGEGRIVLFGEGEEERDHIYIDDVIRIIHMSLLRASTGVINAVSGTAVSFHEVAYKIVAALGIPVRIETTPRKVPITHKHFQAAALHEAFPGYVTASLDQGIRKTIAQLSGADTGAFSYPRMIMKELDGAK